MKTVTKASDLITPKTATVEGFKWQATRKIDESKKFAATADYFGQRVTAITKVADILSDATLTEFVTAACFLSRKSLNHIDLATRAEIIERLVDIAKLKEPSYVAELNQRYFLTCGDALGGMMRNVVGQEAQTKLSLTIMDHLGRQKATFTDKRNRKGKLVSLQWEGRTLLFDRTPKFVGKSIDFILLRNDNIENPADYLACGELKGGIDPAGADEHWKTASTALDRISTAFQKKGMKPAALFFVGAAIENAMSNEIFARMESGQLAAAANFTNEKQLTELVEVLLSL